MFLAFTASELDIFTGVYVDSETLHTVPGPYDRIHSSQRLVGNLQRSFKRQYKCTDVAIIVEMKTECHSVSAGLRSI
jgi:hypothetical protein